MGTPSPKQVEANRANAQKSTGPRTAEGKQRSRRNGLRHGMACAVVVPEEDRQAYRAAMARWRKESGPDNVVEEHLVRRAAVGSVTLDRLDRAWERTRADSAREAVRRWESTQQHRARRKAQDLDRDPSNTVLDLEATAFGCDWLIRRWEAFDAPLRLGNGWDQRTVLRAQLLLGLPDGLPGPDAEPGVRLLWRLAASCSPTTVTRIPDAPGEVPVPADPAGARAALRAFIADQVDRLAGLREESWERAEGPEREAVVIRALAADASRDGELRHRYARDADRSCNAAVRQFLNLRDRRLREHLAIAKEARHCSIPRVPVGGGWWRELDSDAAPPGFERVDLAPADPGSDGHHAEDPDAAIDPTSPPGESTSTPPESPPIEPEPGPEGILPAGPSPAVEPPEALPEADPADDDRPAAFPGAPRRSEPISRVELARKSTHNPLEFHALRNGLPDDPAGASERTGPSPSPDRPAPGRPPMPGSSGRRGRRPLRRR
ncbi:hypothetical protein [Tautonia plasticadhaerens]|uniref:hypothetical protein n=1 Tax=Tautonia plasticadhaerens TaxID=2527974 RepID=UPI0011A3B513|nr:hypothetical protein [Tautonia plasticadhaerens]